MHPQFVDWNDADRLIDREGPIAVLRPDLGRCWLWRGRHDQAGYGVITRNCAPGQDKQAHRLVWVLLRGEIADGLVLDHFACENKGCVNPDHLAAVTERQNVLRGAAPPGLNSRKTHCSHGHEFAGDNLIIGRNGWRQCRACAQRRQQEAKRTPKEDRVKLDQVDEVQGRLAYRPVEAARLLGVDKRTVERLIDTGRLRAVRVSQRLTLVPRAALYEFLGLTEPLSLAELEAAAL